MTQSPCWSVVAVAPLGGDQVIGLDLDDGEVGLGIGADDLAVVDLAAVGEGDRHFVGAAGDVVVGEDVAGAAVDFHDDAATGADLLNRPALAAAEVGNLGQVEIGELPAKEIAGVLLKEPLGLAVFLTRISTTEGSIRLPTSRKTMDMSLAWATSL